MAIRSAIKLKKALFIMFQGIKGKRECPLYNWLNEFGLEIFEEYIANMKNKIFVCNFAESVCKDCSADE